MSEAVFQIDPVRSAPDLEAIAGLFEAYASALGFDLGFQDFSAELASLPGKYAPPAGELLLARDVRRQPLGCVGLRPMTARGCCEMKRLYVSPRGRGLGLGKALIEAIVGQAARIGYREIRLDTAPQMVEAISLYRKAEFIPIEPYYDSPLAGAMFFGRPVGS